MVPIVRLCLFLVFWWSLCEWGVDPNFIRWEEQKCSWKKKKRQINVIMQMMTWNWFCSPFSQDGFDLMEAIFSFAILLLSPASQLYTCHSFFFFFFSFLDGNRCSSCQMKMGCNCLAHVKPTNQVHVFLVEWELWGIARGRGSGGPHSHSSRVWVCFHLPLGSTLSWWTLTSMVRVS